MRPVLLFSLSWLALTTTAYGQQCDFPAGLQTLGGSSSTPLASIDWNPPGTDEVNDEFGSAIVGLGDLNGDGIADFAVGIPGFATTGAVAIFLGRSRLLGLPNWTTPDALIVQGGTGRFGMQLTAGQFIAGGPLDLVVAQQGGPVTVFDGTTLLTGATTSITVPLPEATPEIALARIADTDGDGDDELAIGRPLATGSAFRSGRVYVVRGGPANTTTLTIDQTLNGSAFGQRLGSALAGGDLNNDGFTDLVMGAPEADSQRGAILIAFGDSTSTFTPNLVLMEPNTWPASARKMRLGVGLAVADLDGDGSNDVVVGGHGPTNHRGLAVIHRGPIANPGVFTTGPMTEDAVLSGVPGQHMGSRLTAGDFDGDGFVEIAMAGTQFGNGAAALYKANQALGLSTYSNPRPADAVATLAPVGTGSPQTGFALSFIGDVDGNGITDLAIGSPLQDVARPTPVVGSITIPLSNVGTVDLLGGGFGTEYMDTDGDGFGDPDTTTPYCLRGTSPSSTPDLSDCDDTLAAVNPDAMEACDALDNNCDGLVNLGVGSPVYADVDGDGFGDPQHVSTDDLVCFDLDGDGEFEAEWSVLLAADGDDCNDADASISPAASDVCDGVDNDCDGSADNDPTTWVPLYPDLDFDGFGDANATGAVICSTASRWSADNTDCDDTTALVNPANAEVCDNLDNDCNTLVDDNPTDVRTFFADADGDAFGDAAISVIACDAPTNFVLDATDCDDTNNNAHPANSEECDGIDNNCNGLVDDNTMDGLHYYADSDGDGFGLESTMTVALCTAPAGFTFRPDDCDDGSATIFPGADEFCNGIDDNCDGVVDEGQPVDAQVYYGDADGDGSGDPNTSSLAVCEQPNGFSADADDCDDDNPNVYSAADEVCDGIDNNCDGITDTDAVDATVFFLDSDNDGLGDPLAPTVPLCDSPPGFIADNTDCDDTDSSIMETVFGTSPGADGDGDGFGDATTAGLYCPDVVLEVDCDDTVDTSQISTVSLTSGRTFDGAGEHDHMGASVAFIGDFGGAASVPMVPTADIALSRISADASYLDAAPSEADQEGLLVTTDVARNPMAASVPGVVDVYFGETYFGEDGVPAGAPDVRFVGETPGDLFGHSISSVADLDGDGRSELLVSAPRYTETPNASDINGRVYVFCSGTSRTGTVSATTADAIIQGRNEQHLGWSVAGVGDVGLGADPSAPTVPLYDGIPDVAIGAPSDDSTGTNGEVFVVSGDGLCNTSTVLRTPAPTVPTVPANMARVWNFTKGHMGWQVAGGGRYAGSSNASQLLVGAPQRRASPGWRSGGVYAVTAVLGGGQTYDIDLPQYATKVLGGDLPTSAGLGLGISMHGGRADEACNAVAIADRLGNVYLTPTGTCLTESSDITGGTLEHIRIVLPNWGTTTRPSVRVIPDVDGDGLEDFLLAGAGTAVGTGGLSTVSPEPVIIRGAIGSYSSSISQYSHTLADLASPANGEAPLVMTFDLPDPIDCDADDDDDITTNPPFNALGYSVAAGPDFNGDVFPDLLIGDPAYCVGTSTEVGRTYLVSTVPSDCMP